MVPAFYSRTIFKFKLKMLANCFKSRSSTLTKLRRFSTQPVMHGTTILTIRKGLIFHIFNFFLNFLIFLFCFRFDLFRLKTNFQNFKGNQVAMIGGLYFIFTFLILVFLFEKVFLKRIFFFFSFLFIY